MVLRVALQGSGSQPVGEAADGAEAVHLAISERPELILLDLDMPGTGGLDAIPQLREGCPEVKGGQDRGAVGGCVRQDVERALELDADIYLEKTVEPDRLVAIVHELCGRQLVAAAAARVGELPGQDRRWR